MLSHKKGDINLQLDGKKNCHSGHTGGAVSYDTSKVGGKMAHLVRLMIDNGVGDALRTGNDVPSEP